MKKKLRNNFVYILTFLFFVIVLSLSPICGDDWGNYKVGEQGISMVLSAAKGMYFSWEGRFIGRIFIYIFTFYKFFFVIVTSSLLTLLVYVANKIIGDVKNKIVYFIPLILFLLLNPTSFSQCYTWIAGSITYLYPAIIVLTYFYYLYKKKYFKFSKIEYLILLIVNIITPMFVENIGVAFVFGNLLWLFLNRHAEKKELIKFGILTIFSIGALILMLLSPGTAFRTTYELGFYNMSLIGRMFYNIPNLIGYAITRNIIVLIMMTLAIIYTLKKKNIKIYKLILFAIVPIFGIIQNIYLMIPFAIGNDLANKFAKFWGVFNVNNWYFIFYWILFVALFFYAIVYNFKDSKEKSFLIVLTLVAGVALVSMLVAPIWGERVAIFTEIILLIISLKIIKDCFNRKYNKLLISFMGVLLSYFIIMFSLIFIVQKDRDAYIKYQLQDEKVQEIEVYNHFITYVWTRAPWGDYHSNVFKNYYGIDEKISLKIVNHKFSLAFYDALKKLE